MNFTNSIGGNKMETLELVKKIASALEDKKAEDIIIAASTQQTVIDELEDFARQRGKHLVILNDKVITDYIRGTEQAEKQPPATVESFLQNEKNREEAETKAISLLPFNIIKYS